MRRWCHCAATTPRLQPPCSPLLARAIVSPHPHLHVSALSIPHRRLSHVFSLRAHTKRSGRIHTTTPPPAARPAEYHHTFTRPSISLPTDVPQPVHTSSRTQVRNKPNHPCPRSPYSPGNLSLSPVSLLFSPPPRARHQVALTSLGFARATQVACILSLSDFPCRPKTTSSCTRETRKRVAF